MWLWGAVFGLSAGLLGALFFQIALHIYASAPVHNFILDLLLPAVVVGGLLLTFFAGFFAGLLSKRMTSGVLTGALSGIVFASAGPSIIVSGVAAPLLIGAGALGGLAGRAVARAVA